MYNNCNCKVVMGLGVTMLTLPGCLQCESDFFFFFFVDECESDLLVGRIKGVIMYLFNLHILFWIDV